MVDYWLLLEHGKDNFERQMYEATIDDMTNFLAIGDVDFSAKCMALDIRAAARAEMGLLEGAVEDMSGLLTAVESVEGMDEDNVKWLDASRGEHTLLQRAKLNVRLGRNEDAIRDCHTLIDRCPDYASVAYEVVADACLALGDSDNASMVADEIPCWDDRDEEGETEEESNARYRVTTARIQMAEGHYDHALRELEAARRHVGKLWRGWAGGITPVVDDLVMQCHLAMGDGQQVYTDYPLDPRSYYRKKLLQNDAARHLVATGTYGTVNVSWNSYKDASPDAREAFEGQYGTAGPRVGREQQYMRATDALLEGDVPPVEFANLLDRLDEAGEERRSLGLPVPAIYLGPPNYQDWAGALEQSGAASLTPLVEREGREFIRQEAQKLFDRKGLDLESRAEIVEGPRPDRSGDGISAYFILEGYRPEGDRPAGHINSDEFREITGFLSERLRDRYPEERYDNEWLVRNMLVMEAMERVGITPAWIANKNRPRLNRRVLEMMGELQMLMPCAALLTYHRIRDALTYIDKIATVTPSVTIYWLETTPLMAFLHQRRGRRPALLPETNNPGDIVRQVGAMTEFNRAEWGLFAKLAAEDAGEWMRKSFSIMRIGLRRRDTVHRDPREMFCSTIRMLVSVGAVRRSKRDMLIRKYAIGVETLGRNWREHLHLIRAFARLTNQSVRERGFSLQELDRQFVSAIDWADGYVAANGAAVPKSSWHDYQVASAAWHRRVVEEVSSETAQPRAETGPEWVSLIDSHEAKPFLITPIVSRADTLAESEFMNNCLGASPYYRQLCIAGDGRLFRISAASVSGRQEAPVATLLITRDTAEGCWQVGEVYGPGNSTVSTRVKRLSKDIAVRYTKAEEAGAPLSFA